MPPVARVGDVVVCAADIHIVPPGLGVPTPFPVVGQITEGSAKLIVFGARAARRTNRGTHAVCPGPNNFKITAGSTKTIVTGERLARTGDETTHCEEISPGVPDPTHVPPSTGTILGGAFTVIAGP